MNIKPCGHYVLVKPMKAVEHDELYKRAKEAGVALPDDLMKREDYASTDGELVAIGFQAWKAYGKDNDGKPWAKVGDRVKFKRHTQDQIFDLDDLDDEGEPIEYYLMVDENITAVVEK